MGLFDKLFNKKDSAPIPAPRALGEQTLYILTVNARLQPMHRGDIYEDPLDERLRELEIGEITGGGTMLGEGGEISCCDIEILLRDGSDELLQRLLGLLSEFELPCGSQLTRGDDEPLPLGRLEGLALYLNGTELPAETYETCDVNHVIEEIHKLLGNTGKLFSWREGPQDTALYFYGESFEDMSSRMSPFLAEYPLCQKCKVIQIA